MTTQAQDETPRRSAAARVGVCLLNLWQPGLGLVRLGSYRLGLLLIAATQAAWFAILLFYAFGPELNFERYVVLLSFVIVWAVATYGTAIALSWRRSRLLTPRSGWLWRWYGVVGVGLAVLGLSFSIPEFRDYYGSFYTASRSMAPTLQPSDRMIARMWDLGPLRRGDVVIVSMDDQDWVTRIVGVPGDRVAMTDGIVILNGAPVAQQVRSQNARLRALHEQFPGETSAHLIYDSGRTFLDDMAELRLREREYFVLGDNRDHSRDSRMGHDIGGLGTVPRENITGRLLFRWWRSGVGPQDGRL
jgi:signal peptidase I